MKNVLITGVSGQDGIFLTSKLLEENKFNIFGVTRSNHKYVFKKINSLQKNGLERIKLINTNLENSQDVNKLILDIKPDIVFNLTGPSSVYDSFKDNNLSKDLMIKIFDNISSACINLNNFPNFFQASSSEMYGTNKNKKLDENDYFMPNSPYAEGKYEIHKKIMNLNKEYGFNIKSGIMFNHESEFRTDDYLFMKIINFALNQKRPNKKLEIGSLEYIRDWSFAGDLTNAIFDITVYGKDSVYCIGSGEGNTIRDLLIIVFEYFNLDYKEFVLENKNLLRANDPVERISNPKKLVSELNWKPNLNFEELVIRCIEKKFIN